ncbi:6625_t:CDS:1, partial [Paraglomus occultum]
MSLKIETLMRTAVNEHVASIKQQYPDIQTTLPIEDLLHRKAKCICSRRSANAFLLYRKEVKAQLMTVTTKPRMDLVSKVASERWRREVIRKKAFFHSLARVAEAIRRRLCAFRQDCPCRTKPQKKAPSENAVPAAT